MVLNGWSSRRDRRQKFLASYGLLGLLSSLLNCLSLSVCLVLLGCRHQTQDAAVPDFPQTAELQIWGGETMGTTYRVTAVTPMAKVADLKLLIEDELQSVNQQMSTYIPDSEISRFNNWAGGEDAWFQVSSETAEVVSQSIAISEWTSGAFDVTVGPLVRLWGFGPDGLPKEIPTAEQIEASRNRVGFEKLRSSDQALGKSQADLEIDLSAIAKGHGVDRIAELLEREGVRSYFVEVGGEVRTAGAKPGGEKWRLGIERPTIGQRGILTVLELGDAAVATSGSYRNLYEMDGVRYSHTIDPRTGRTVQDEIVSATVIADSCSLADGLATSMMCLGFEAGLELANEHGWAVLLIRAESDELQLATSVTFDERFPGWQSPATATESD